MISSKYFVVFGLPGSGSSTTTKVISQLLGIPLIETGELFKLVGKEENGNYGEFFDEAVDSTVVETVKNSGGIVITTKDLHQHPEIQQLRQQGHLKLIKVTADEQLRVERVAKRKSEPVDKVRDDLRERFATDTETYCSRYSWFSSTYEDFDIYITNNHAPELSELADALGVDIDKIHKLFADVLNQEMVKQIRAPDYRELLERVREKQEKLIVDCKGAQQGGHKRKFVIT
jgi:cytidylate kinase